MPKLSKDELKDTLSEKEDTAIANFLAADENQKRQIILFLKNTTNGVGKLKDLLKGSFNSLEQSQKDIIETMIKDQFGVGKKNFVVNKWINNGKR